MNPSYRRVLKRTAWDALSLAAAIAIVYGVVELLDVHGWALGAIMSIAAITFGIFAFKMIYPMWFGNNMR